jgi:hypothetical protein
MLAAAALVRARGIKMMGFFPGFALTRGIKLAVPQMVTVVSPSDAATFRLESLAGILCACDLPDAKRVMLIAAMHK